MLPTIRVRVLIGDMCQYLKFYPADIYRPTPKVTIVEKVERGGKFPFTSFGLPPKFPQMGLTASVTPLLLGRMEAVARETDASTREIAENIFVGGENICPRFSCQLFYLFSSDV